MLDRVNAMSDGVVAIALTLLVLSIEVPQSHDFTNGGLIAYLVKVEYQLTVYLVSFVLIGCYWVLQNVMFHYFRHGTRVLTWLNLLFLFLLTLLPLTTQLIGTYRDEPLVMVVYGAVSIACSLSLALIWWYSNHIGMVVWPKIDPTVERTFMRRILYGACLSLVAVGVSFLNVRMSHFVFLSMPLLYLSDRQVDRHWSELVAANNGEVDGIDD
ncbi:TMEM175 family protein [Thalassoroseus pseudoceratinae]|uniref:TMEM175 family protein n=1 Tax=Thalassoroseus pseudoceratinae TaxID=2713176 RepID=UPI001423E1CF|nr:TMEM175 family protein [Thalassoroseus pseudoceratinae]